VRGQKEEDPILPKTPKITATNYAVEWRDSVIEGLQPRGSKELTETHSLDDRGWKKVIEKM